MCSQPKFKSAIVVKSCPHTNSTPKREHTSRQPLLSTFVDGENALLVLVAYKLLTFVDEISVRKDVLVVWLEASMARVVQVTIPTRLILHSQEKFSHVLSGKFNIRSQPV